MSYQLGGGEGGHNAKVSGACGEELGAGRGRAQEQLPGYRRRRGGRVGVRKGEMQVRLVDRGTGVGNCGPRTKAESDAGRGKGRRPIDRQKKGSSMHIGMHVWPLITRAAAACKSPLHLCPYPSTCTIANLALAFRAPVLTLPNRRPLHSIHWYYAKWNPHSLPASSYHTYLRSTRGCHAPHVVCQRILYASLLAVLNGSRTHLSASPFPHPLHLTSDPSRDSSVFRSLPPPILLLKPIRLSL